MKYKYFAAAIGLAAANILMQAMASVPNWDTAMERTWFQITAIIVIAILPDF